MWINPVIIPTIATILRLSTADCSNFWHFDVPAIQLPMCSSITLSFIITSCLAHWYPYLRGKLTEIGNTGLWFGELMIEILIGNIENSYKNVCRWIMNLQTFQFTSLDWWSKWNKIGCESIIILRFIETICIL